MCAAVVPNNLDFLKYDWKSESWNLVMVAGVLIGAFIASAFLASDAPIAHGESAILRLKDSASPISLDSPAELFGWSSLSNWQSLSLSSAEGSLLAWIALCQRCTSGHAIMGMSHFQLPSLVAVLGFLPAASSRPGFCCPSSSLNP